MNKINQKLDTICEKLSGLNYVCSIEVFSGPWAEEKKHSKYSKNEAETMTIKSIVSNEMLVHRFRESTLEELTKALKTGFLYSGSKGHYPSKKYFGSSDYKQDIKKIEDSITRLFKNCSKIVEFEIQAGHPFHPIFWEFAFLLKDENTGYVFIGSSCD